jgi:tRNA/tmRNA/rRNA uracil-C5-methylase (TrmA/RlmC/RlmD family)
VKEVMQIKALAQAVASCSASEEARDEAAAIVLLSKARIGELDLLTTLIEQSTVPGEHVIDPFCGSGSTGVAAVRGKRRFTGIELDKTWADVARGRIGHA